MNEVQMEVTTSLLKDKAKSVIWDKLKISNLDTRSIVDLVDGIRILNEMETEETIITKRNNK